MKLSLFPSAEEISREDTASLLWQCSIRLAATGSDDERLSVIHYSMLVARVGPYVDIEEQSDDPIWTLFFAGYVAARAADETIERSSAALLVHALECAAGDERTRPLAAARLAAIELAAARFERSTRTERGTKRS